MYGDIPQDPPANANDDRLQPAGIELDRSSPNRYVFCRFDHDHRIVLTAVPPPKNSAERAAYALIITRHGWRTLFGDLPVRWDIPVGMSELQFIWNLIVKKVPAEEIAAKRYHPPDQHPKWRYEEWTKDFVSSP